MKGKKLASFVLAFVVLAGLGGCGKTNAKTEDDWFEDSTIINTGYRREDIGRNDILSYTNVFDASERWAAQFAVRNYASCSPTFVSSEYVSGGYINNAAFEEVGLVFGAVTCSLRFKLKSVPEGLTPDEDGFYGFTLQVITSKSDETFRLLGFVTNQTRQIKRPSELTQFLKTVPGYENFQIEPDLLYFTTGSEPLSVVSEYKSTPVAVPNADEPVKIVNLTELSGDLFAFDAIPVGKTLFVFGYYTSNPTRYDSSKVVIKAFSIDGFCFLYEHTFPYQNLMYGDLIVENGGLLIRFNVEEEYAYYRATENGVEKLETIPESAAGVYRLSETALIKQTEDGGLALENDGMTTTLFTGVPFSDQIVNIDESCDYKFKYRITNTTFLYMKYGYEWVDECGVYDIVTGKSAVLTHPNTDTLLPRAADNGRVILSADSIEEHTSYGPYVYDNISGEINDLAWFSNANDGNEPVFGLFGDTLAALSKENGGFAIRLLNLKTETVPHIYRINNYEAANPTAVYDTDDAVWFITRGHSSSDTYLFYISK